MIPFLKLWLYATILFFVLYSTTMYVERKLNDLPEDNRFKRWWRRNIIGEEPRG
jgi:hypothetical protein